MSKSLVERPVSNVPAFMAEQPSGMEVLAGYVKPPRLKVIQKSADSALLGEFSVGDLIAQPQNIIVAAIEKNEKGKPTGYGSPFYFTPVFFFVEYCAWNPLELKGTLPAVRERTFDPNSALAAKCNNPKLWFEKCPELPEKSVRNVEHLNFIVSLVNNSEIGNVPMLMGFSRGNHRYGTNFAGLVKMRKAPLYGCQFSGRVARRENTKGEWYGIDVSNPAGDSGVTPFIENPQIFEEFKKLHLEFAELHEKNLIRADYDEDEPVTAEM